MSTSTEILPSAIAKFSATFTKEVDTSSSSVSSPLSAQILLSLLSLGVSGKSREEILNALHFNDDMLRSGMSQVSKNLKQVKGVELSVANKVYVKDGHHKLNETFQKNAVNLFHAELEKVDFSEAAAAASVINRWVETKTNNKIKDLIDPTSLSADTMLVLVNALYFKGIWKYKFPEDKTQDSVFNVDLEKKINVPFMNLKEHFRYGRSEELDAQLLELPYEGGEANLLVVLPNKVDGLSGLLEKLATGADLLKAVDTMRRAEVIVSLPKFKIETTIDLKGLLMKLGVRSIFERGHNDLTNFVEPATPLFVSYAVQKAFIEVNEVGTEAAAASGMVMMLRSMPLPPVRFVADRPFLVALFVRGVVLFQAVFRPQK